QLDATVGDSLVLKVSKPSGLSRDAPLSTEDDATIRMRVDVKAIASDLGFGRFGLQANQVPPYNAFVSLPVLQKELDTGPRANLLLLGGGNLSLDQAQAALKKTWTLADAQLDLLEIDVPGAGKEVELRTPRVFLDDFTAQPALKADPAARGVLGYFVNEFRLGEHATPYSIVAAMGAPVTPAGLKDDEIVVNTWLAEDLGAKPGDKIAVKYYVMGPMRRLEERTQAFTVRSVTPLEGAAADRELMPDFPGLKDAENCREWDPGFKIDTDRIRDKDQKYWDEHKGTPKAFVSLAAGQKLWKNRFGDYTAVRYPGGEGAKARIAASLRETLDPKLAGLNFLPVRAQAQAAGDNAMDFGGLFIGFSFFLIVAALLLMGLLFRFGLERRTSEIGTLLALGFSAARVRRLLLAEGLGIAVTGGLLGVAGGVAYARAMLYGLATAWRGAVNTSSLFFHAEPATLAAGALGGVLIVFLTIWFGVRGQARRPARELLGAGTGVGAEFFETKPRKSRAA
ncbi:MAG: FtsX-like permease family protein, partial [Planctomycetota bacterium]|nr:FtsX-like permease family protein [Planctomycetota bacterium]